MTTETTNMYPHPFVRPLVVDVTEDLIGCLFGSVLAR